MTTDANYWIQNLQLEPHPEGGYFKEVYRSEEMISHNALPSRFSGARSYATSIYFLLTGQKHSKFHRIQSDETWHFYTGDSLTIHQIDKSSTYSQQQLGLQLEQGQHPQITVPAKAWFGATVDAPHGYTLVGCTVAPGFHFDDFELANRDSLLESYPEHQSIIQQLT